MPAKEIPSQFHPTSGKEEYRTETKRQDYLHWTNWLVKRIRIVRHKCTTKQCNNSGQKSALLWGTTFYVLQVQTKQPTKLLPCLWSSEHKVSFLHSLWTPLLWEQGFPNCTSGEDRMHWPQCHPRTYKLCRGTPHPNSNCSARSQLSCSHASTSRGCSLPSHLPLILCLSKAEVLALHLSSPLGFCLIKECHVSTRSKRKRRDTCGCYQDG